ncbi:MAG: MaoC/PaaZ C-terminal domain-containing protein [Dehalococcoidia bacterium]
MINRFMHFDDYQTGMNGTTTPRTITECDIITFACLTGDYSQMHMDRHYAENLSYGGRIAHGLLGSSLVIGGLSTCAPHVLGRDNPGAFLQGFDVNYRDVFRMGDTFRTEWRITEKSSNPDVVGVHSLKTSIRVLNQDSNLVADGLITVTIADSHANTEETVIRPLESWELDQFVADRDMVYYAEDYTPDGQSGETESRTLTEADIVNFCGFTGDYSPQYVDAVFSGKALFGGRIVHPMLSFNIAFAYWLREWLRLPMPDDGFAGHLSDSWIFLAPVKIGDTIHCKYKTVSTKTSRSKPGMGLVRFGLQVVNQRNEAVQEGSVLMMYPSRQGAQDDSV